MEAALRDLVMNAERFKSPETVRHVPEADRDIQNGKDPCFLPEFSDVALASQFVAGSMQNIEL